ncbi:hypothetical protein Tco_0008834 [Tanacetum coccineum]
MDNAIAFPSVPRYQLMDCPVVVDALIEGFRARRIHVDGGSSLEDEMRSLGAVASTIHSMIKFPTSNGIATIATTRETLGECRKIEEAQALSWHARVTNPTPMQISSEVINPRVSLAPVETRPWRPGKEPMQLDDMEER